MITATTTSMRNPFGFTLVMFMLCVALQVVHGCLPKEREALLQFKAAIVDNYGMLSSWTTPDCCQWQGIRCSNLTAHILGLHLPGDFRVVYEVGQHYFSGEIYNSLMELGQLEYLNLSSNYFSDTHIPKFIGSLTNLRYLDLSSCYFSGEIPSQFGSLSHLKYLNLAGNYLNGSIPRQLGNLSQLQELYLKGNDGTLKIENGGQWLSNLISLTHLSLDSVSNFDSSASLLSIIAKLPKLRELSLIDCGLSEHFVSSRPSYFNISTSLSLLHLSGNIFMSPMIFQWLSNITFNLVELDLSDNLLKGSTSNHSYTVMNSLKHLDLSSNYFKARDLKSFMNICNLNSLIMAENNFTEDLPSILGNLSSGCVRHSLQELDLSHNHIIGNFPELSVFSSLKRLVLDENDLSGEIPQDIILPPQLESLSIQQNTFEGGIPKSFGNACALHSLDMSLNSLSEELPMIIYHLSGCARNSLQELSFSSNKINGTLPDLSIFLALKKLDLTNNELSGKIPKDSKLPSKLEDFSIRSNTLEGGIPKSFGNACSLLSFDMSNNTFSDELPMIIYHLSGCARYSLEELIIGMNHINGTLPDFSTFTSLKRLYLFENKLNGDIPKDIQFPPQLELLYIYSNSLKGVLSDYHFANMSKLEELYLYENSLTLAFTENWVPLFQLLVIQLGSCKLGPTFPKWLRTQNKFFIIDISNAEISDIVPEWFWVKLPLQKVILMNISYNNLRGIIPNFSQKNLFYEMTLGSNKFEGTIPLFLLNSQHLDLSNNKFSGSLSLLCGNGTIQSLIHLDLSYNQLSGHIPNCWRQLNSLEYLDLSHNNFVGKIPTSLGSLPYLQALLLRNNNLVEGIPFSLMKCRELIMLDMSKNKLSGSIPNWIGTTYLQILSLGRNQFSGSLPLKICCLKDIHVLDLSLNNLSGKIPKCIKDLTSMSRTISWIDNGDHEYIGHISLGRSYKLNAFLMWKGSERRFMNKGLSLLKNIDLSSNHFTGEIPIEIEKLSGLISLNLSRNNLIGKIPSNIGKLASLDSLDLSRNQLDGSIPQSLAQIHRLEVLDLSHNHLSGEIPTGTQLQSFNISSYEDNLDLCGPPLETLCNDRGPTPEARVEVQDEYSFFNNDFFISMAFGFILSFWIIFGSILFNRSWRHAYFNFLNNLEDNVHQKLAVLLKYLR